MCPQKNRWTDRCCLPVGILYRFHCLPLCTSHDVSTAILTPPIRCLNRHSFCPNPHQRTGFPHNGLRTLLPTTCAFSLHDVQKILLLNDEKEPWRLCCRGFWQFWTVTLHWWCVDISNVKNSHETMIRWSVLGKKEDGKFQLFFDVEYCCPGFRQMGCETDAWLPLIRWMSGDLTVENRRWQYRISSSLPYEYETRPCSTWWWACLTVAKFYTEHNGSNLLKTIR